MFSWTGLEGYMLYKAVVVVFDTGSHRARPLYMIGYGLSLMICIVTVVAGVLVVPYRHVVRISILLILISKVFVSGRP